MTAYAWAATPSAPGPVRLNPGGAAMPNPGGATMPNPSGAGVPNPPGALTPPTTVRDVPFVPPPGTVVVPFGGYGGYGGYYRYPRYYVVAEKRGPSITWSTYEWTNQVYAKMTQLQVEKNTTMAANIALNREIADLKKQIADLKKEIAAQTDDTAKAELATKLAGLEKLLLEREGALKPPVHWVARGPLDAKRLEAFLTQLQREAYQAAVKAGVNLNVQTPSMPPRRGGYGY